MDLDNLLEEFKDDRKSQQHIQAFAGNTWDTEVITKPKNGGVASLSKAVKTGGIQAKSSWDNDAFDNDFDNNNSIQNNNHFGGQAVQSTNYGGYGASNGNQGVQQKKASVLDDDLDDLINDIDYSGGSGGTQSGKLQQQQSSGFTYEIPQDKMSVQNVALGGKCYALYLGGSLLLDCQTQNSLNPRSCNKLRCYNCDKVVHRYTDSKWESTVDYLFVRNHNTNTKELVKGLEQAAGYAAYACQCKWKSMMEVCNHKQSNCEEILQIKYLFYCYLIEKEIIQFQIEVNKSFQKIAGTFMKSINLIYSIFMEVYNKLH